MRSFGDLLAVGALVCGLAIWIFPPLRMAASRKRSSPAAVGFFIGIFFVIACLSAGLLLLLPAFAFAERTSFVWYGLYAIATFWVSVMAATIYDGVRRSRDPPNQTDKR
jgi:Kef-type K+ transport system membrane component KefB